MKKVLGYLGIFILLIIIVLPPALRIFYREKEIVVVDKIQILSCKRNNFQIASSYKNDKIMKIRFSYKEDELDLENEESIYENETLLKEALSSDNNSKLDQSRYNENILTYELNIENASNITLGDLASFTMEINSQRDYYQYLGYTCSIISG